MKKISFLLMCLFAILSASCSKEDEPASATVMVNVTLEGPSANPSLVRLYKYEDAKDFDNSYNGANHYGTYLELLDKQGNVIEPAYTSESLNGVNTFSDVLNGKYIIIAIHKPRGYDWSFSYYYGYKIIDVDGSLETHFIDFIYGHYLQGYKEFVKF